MSVATRPDIDEVVETRVPVPSRAVAEPALSAPRQPRGVRNPRWWGVPSRVWIRRIHLWATLSLGALLLVVTTSGAAVVLEPEINRLLYAEFYRATSGATTFGLDQAVGIVEQAYLDHHIHYVTPPRRGDRYLIEVDEQERPMLVFVDPVDGTLHGPLDPTAGPMGWLSTLHTSLFAEETLLPGTGWPLSQVLLGISALALLLMTVTGAVLWWPGVKRFFTVGFGVRLRRNSYTTNHDLHKVLGFIALLPLLLWGLTGANFEFYDQVRTIWYAVTPGDAPPEIPASASGPGTGPGVSARDAMSQAIAAAPGSRFSSIVPPSAEANYYSVWLARGIDTYEYFDWPGTFEVRIDRYSGALLGTAYLDYPNLTTEIYEGWTFPIHTGMFAPWYVRLLWVLFGLAPLGLAVTGVAMWWLKRRGIVRASPRVVAVPSLAPAD